MPDRILLGKLNGAFRARISRPGYDVKTATLGQLLMSDVANGRIIQRLESGTVDLASGSSATVPYPNRGVAPYMFIASGRIGGATWSYPDYDIGVRNITASSAQFVNERDNDNATVYWFAVVI